MTQLNTIGVDLAKSVIQVSVLNSAGKEVLNRSLTRTKFQEFLVKQKRSLVAFEACASAHFWARTAQNYQHEVRILPAISVAPFRQGHKTDENDALAVAEAAGRPNH
jgi:transposase|tara:strand:- start:15279 stop:15599 length:321 start_codon:yes stop_codon:yes gene_type:complete